MEVPSFTCCEVLELLLFCQPPVPLNAAERLCVPTDKEELEKEALPLPSTLALPSVVAPSLNATEPVGVPAPESAAATCAVSVTDCPYVDGLGELESEVVVPSCTFCVTLPLLLLVQPGAPTNAAEST